MQIVAKVVKVQKSKSSEKAGSFNHLIVPIEEDCKKCIDLLCFDLANLGINNLETGDVISCNPVLWKDREGKLRYKIKSFQKLPKDTKLGYTMQLTGKVTSLDVHEASGAGKQTISLKVQNYLSLLDQPELNKKPLKNCHVIVAKNCQLLNDCSIGDTITVKGYLNIYNPQRFIFKQLISAYNNDKNILY